MTISVTLPVANAAMAALLAAIETGSGVARIQLYSGTRPATGGTPTTLLLEIPLVSPAAPAPTGGVLVLQLANATSIVTATGIATWFRLLNRDGTAVLDGSVGLSGSGADLLSPVVAFSAGQAVRIGGLVLNGPSVDTRFTPYANRATWNRPVSELTVDPASNDLAAILWNYGASPAGNFNLLNADDTFQVWDATAAAGLYSVSVLGGTNLGTPAIPWNQGWGVAPSIDGSAVVYDPRTGEEWNITRITSVNHTARSMIAQTLYQVPGDYRTRAEGFSELRAAGLQYGAMLLRPWEIAAGTVAHSLALGIVNMGGDGYRRPATKIGAPGAAGLPNRITAGTRFALPGISQTDIDDWIDLWVVTYLGSNRTAQAALVAAMQVLAEALRDYGMTVVETSSNGTIYAEGRLSGGAAWDALGLQNRSGAGAWTTKELPRDLFDGLITQARLVAYAEPPA